jgi:hypothetical protein
MKTETKQNTMFLKKILFKKDKKSIPARNAAPGVQWISFVAHGFYRGFCWPLMIGFLLICYEGSGQVVSPIQGGHYSPVVKNVRDMAAPPSGLFVLWYNGFFNSDTYVDRNGNKFNSVDLSSLDPLLPDISVGIDLGGYTSVPALFWASNFKLLGGAKYMAGISPNYISADVSIITERGGIVIDTTYTNLIKGKNSGFSDLYVAPLGLSWEMKHADLTFLYGFYAPTGKYETGSSEVVGLGFWTHAFQGYGYYYPMTDRSTAIMIGLTYEANGKIKDADVRPGNRFSLEWGLSQYLSPRLELAVQGGHNWQVSDDKGSEVYWPVNYRDRKSTIGISASYWVWKDRLMISPKYAFDFGARQRFLNNTWLVNIVFVTGILN